MLNFDFQARRNEARAGMVGWNGIFRLFRFSGVLGQPREVHPKFRKEIPENVCSILFPTRNFRNFWSNGKRPRVQTECQFTIECWKTETNRYNSHRQFRGPGGRRHLQGNACVMSSLVSKTFKIAPNLEFFMSLRS